LVRGLRFKLTVAYATFFALLAALAGVIFHRNLSSSLEANLRDVLEQEWVAVRAYLRIEKNHHDWIHDRQDREEVFTIARLQRIFVLADENGRVLQSSTLYQRLGVERPASIARIIRSGQPEWRIRTAPDGVAYILRSGVIMSNDHERKPYFVAIGRSMADNKRVIDRFTQTYAVAVPILILFGCMLGWMLAGRALKPVTEVAGAAQRISGSNLSLRIPTRGTGDELDFLTVTFNRMIDRLEASLRQARQFSTDVSHELRTPITALRGQLEVALLNAKDVEQLREAIIGSLDDIERLSQIVRALLLLSQAESGQLTLQKVRTDVVAAILGILEQYQFVAEENGVRLSSDLPPECHADVDRVQFERLISNLLSNALKYTPSGGKVHLRLRSCDGLVHIEVGDTGIGIPAEHLPHIFERFYRVSSSHALTQRGMGLGLSFVAWIVKAHGGRIDVSSETGKGSKFSVYVPQSVEIASLRESSAEPVPAQAVKS
jgi:heavy metal sensor kinase